MGEMADLTLYDDPFPEREDEIERPVKNPVRCKYCGKDGLSWKEIAPSKWRLMGEHGIHSCSEYTKAS